MNQKSLILIFILLLLIFPLVSARSFQVSSIDMDYVLEPSGKVQVTEIWNYKLSGCYKELYIQKPNTTISNPNGGCQGATCSFEYKSTNTISGDPELILKGDFCDKEVVASFNYTIENQIKSQIDTTQFFYFIYGGKTAVSTNLKINLMFPGDVNKITKFIHAQNYNLEEKENILFISKRVNPYEVIEVNFLMPKEWFSNDLPKENYTATQITDLENNWEKEYTVYTKENVKKEANTFTI
ncbi:MAG: DUF2207 domain-containing protein, partial [archaeon]